MNILGIYLDNKIINTIWLNITSKCNNKCDFCYNNIKQKNMGFSKIKAYVNLIKKIGPKEVILIGGEPTLHPDFIKILDLFNKINIKPNIVSNGITFANNQFTKLVLPRVKRITISIHGPPKIHNTLTKNKCAYDLAIKGIKNIIAIDKLKLSTNTSISKKNINKIIILVSTLYKLGLRNIGFNMCTSFIENKDCFGPKEFYKKTEKLFLKIKKEFKDLNFRNITAIPKCVIQNKMIANYYSSGCHIVSGSGLTIDVNGYIIPCTHWVKYKLVKLDPNISLINFYNLWKKLKLFRNKIATYPIKECVSCKDKYICCGGCPILWRCYNPKTEIIK